MYVIVGLLSWILKGQGVSPIMHYLDDFLTLASPDSTTCQQNLEIIKSVYLHLHRHPIGLEKGRRSIHITYLSGYCLGHCKDEGHTLLSLVGLLQHSTKVARSGCAFLSRMYSAVDKQNSRFNVYSLLLRPTYADCMSLLLTGKE